LAASRIGLGPIRQGVWVSIKSDRWIRRMAVEHRMIEPFSDKQVRDGVI